MASKDFRLVVRDGTDRYEYDRETFAEAYAGWIILIDHGKPGVTPKIERNVNGQWRTADPATGEVL